MKARDYKAIKAWGKVMGSFEYYVVNQQQEALRNNAPVNAIYKSGNKWHTTEDIKDSKMREYIEKQL